VELTGSSHEMTRRRLCVREAVKTIVKAA